MKRKRGRKPAGRKKSAGPAESTTSPDSTSSPSTEASDSPRDDHAEEEDNNTNAPPVVDAGPGAAVPEPSPPPPPAALPQPSEPPRRPAIPPADITYSRPKVGAVYGRVKLKFKSSSKTVDSPLRPQQQQQDSSEAQVPLPPTDAAKSESAVVPEVTKGADTEKAPVTTDGQQADGQGMESSDGDKEKVARKVGGIKIKLAGLPSGETSTPDPKAESADEPAPSKQEAVLESKKMEGVVEVRSSPESEEKQSPLERQHNEKELAIALEAIKKVMKMDAADPFNVPVDPVALEIPLQKG